MDHTHAHMTKRELKRTDLYRASLVKGKHRLTKPQLLQMLQKEAIGWDNIVKAYTDLYPFKEALNRYLQPTPSVLQLKLGQQLRIVRVHELFRGKYTKVHTRPGLLTFNHGSTGCIWSKDGKLDVKEEEVDEDKKEGKQMRPNARWGQGNLFPDKKPLAVLHAEYSGAADFWECFYGDLPECQLTQKFLNHFVTDHRTGLDRVKQEEEDSEYEDEEEEEDEETDKEGDDTITSEGYFSCEDNTPELDSIIGENMEFGEKLSEYCSFTKTQTKVSEDIDTKVIPKFNEHTFLMFFTSSSIPDIQNLVLISRTEVGKFVLWKIADTSDKDEPRDVGRAVLLETPDETLPCGGSVGLFGKKNSAGNTQVVSEIGIFLDHAFGHAEE